MMRTDAVGLAWALGIGLAVLAYVVGPQMLMFQFSSVFDELAWRIGDVIGQLSAAGRDVVRAAAIGLYVTFVALSIMVIRRGGRAKAALFWISVLFFGLIGRVEMVTQSNGRWTLALLLALFGAATMTQRMRQTALVPRY